MCLGSVFLHAEEKSSIHMLKTDYLYSKQLSVKDDIVMIDTYKFPKNWFKASEKQDFDHHKTINLTRQVLCELAAL